MREEWHEEAERMSDRDIRRIGTACPVCPECKRPLVFRLHPRRFIEDDRYVECENGHLWSLTLQL